MALPTPTPIQAQAELCKRSFHKFVKEAWHIVDPSEFTDSAYIYIICSHLEWVYYTGNKLVINIPPRHATPAVTQK